MSQWNTDTKNTCFIDSCACSKEASKPKIVLEYDVWRVMVHLTKEVKSEWQAFLTGVEDAEGVRVTGYWIPKQKVTASTVENLDVIDASVVAGRAIVCSIHSHADMAVFHSTVDMESTCKSAWVRHHITINNKLEIASKSQYALPCSKIGFVDSEVLVAGMPQEPVVEGMANIEKQTYSNNWTMGGAYVPPKDVVWPKQDKVVCAHDDDLYNDTYVSRSHKYNRYNEAHTHGRGLSHV
jgi:hypothetical protein